jgi:triphosphoribosyl-dephospho-CoA synthase
MTTAIRTAPAAAPPPVRRLGAADIADAATVALLAEAELTPKPGLVDRRGTGAHTDMNLPLLRRSAETLRPWFAVFARVAQRHREPSKELRQELAALGRSAEADMLATTGGVNTHRGAIWALGLLAAAAALRPAAAGAVATTAAAIARYPDDACPPEALLSHGTRARAAFGVHGARGQARHGFPHVVGVALPALRAARRLGAAEETAHLTALLALMATLDDTCVLHRGGRAGLSTVQDGAARVLRAGGPGTAEGRRLLDDLDRRLTCRRLSPGGCADLLAATLFLDSLDLLEA